MTKRHFHQDNAAKAPGYLEDAANCKRTNNSRIIRQWSESQNNSGTLEGCPRARVPRSIRTPTPLSHTQSDSDPSRGVQQRALYAMPTQYFREAATRADTDTDTDLSMGNNRVDTQPTQTHANPHPSRTAPGLLDETTLQYPTDVGTSNTSPSLPARHHLEEAEMVSLEDFPRSDEQGRSHFGYQDQARNLVLDGETPVFEPGKRRNDKGQSAFYQKLANCDTWTLATATEFFEAYERLCRLTFFTRMNLDNDNRSAILKSLSGSPP